MATVISRAGGDITSIDVIRHGKDSSVRDITVDVAESEEKQIVDALKQQQGVHLINVSDRTFLVHLGGKITMQPTLPIKHRNDLSRVYTPGVAKICAAIHENPKKAYICGGYF